MPLRLLSWASGTDSSSTIPATGSMKRSNKLSSKQQPSSNATGSSNNQPLLAASPRRVRLNSAGGGETRDDIMNVNDSNCSTAHHRAAAAAPNTNMNNSNNNSSNSPARPRGRLNSRDIPRTYSGLYGNPDDLLTFELNRRQMIQCSGSSGGVGGRDCSSSFQWLFVCATYISIVSMLQLVFMMAFHSYSIHWSWTLTNVVHGLCALVYVHWLKGSFLYDEQGEMDHLTIWEQLEGTKHTKTVREVLFMVPTVLTYVACHVSQYDVHVCAINIFVWIICMLAKLPFMNGVRLFGINRTAGIDDDDDDSVDDDNNTPTSRDHQQYQRRQKQQ